MTVFVDSNVYVALYNPKDPLNSQAEELSGRLRGVEVDFFTTNFILAESYTVLSQRAGREKAIIFGEIIKRGETKIIRMSEELEEEAWSIFKKIPNKNLSYVDCSSFAAIKKFGIANVFSFDSDFERFSKRFDFEVLR